MANYPTNQISSSGSGALKWVVLFLVVAVVAVGIVYYVMVLMGGDTSYNGQQYQDNQNLNQTAGSVEGNAELNTMLQDLNSEDLNEIDAGLSQNDSDLSSF